MAMSNISGVMFGYPTSSSPGNSEEHLTGQKVRDVLGLISVQPEGQGNHPAAAIARGSFNLEQFKEGILFTLQRLIDQTKTINECIKLLDDSEDSDPLFASRREAVRAMEEQMDAKWKLFNESVEQLLELVDRQARDFAEIIPETANRKRKEIQNEIATRLHEGVIEKESI